jgi:polyketide cyclase/dehydrase/lipid transport protein
MVALIRREFIVDLPLERAWRHLARVEEWPSWARHIRRIEMQPPGELGPDSTGYMQLINGLKPVWKVTEFKPHRSWKWAGSFLWLTIEYDHLFEEVNPAQTKITFLVEATGFGASFLGRLFALV